jgi:hypothetical protein
MPYRRCEPEVGCAWMVAAALLAFVFALGLVVGRCL